MAAFLLLLLVNFVAKNTIGRSWYYLTTRERRHLRWVTIILRVLRVREADIIDPDRRREVCALIAEIVDDYRADWTAQTRGRNLSGLTWRGVVEIDVRRNLASDGHAAATMAALGVDTGSLATDERLIVVHVHLVLDGAGRAADGDLDGEGWAGHVGCVLRATWMGPWRVLIKGLRTDQTVPEAVTRLHGYCHKDRRQYATGGLGDTPVRYGDHYEWSWTRLVSEAYAGLNRELRSRR